MIFLAYFFLLATFAFLMITVSSPLSFIIGAVFVVFCFALVLVIVENM